MDEKNLTDDQKKMIKSLKKSYMRRSAFLGGKFAMSLILANMVVSILDAFYVHNNGFVFAGSFISAFLIFRSFRIAADQERDRVKKELEKITATS